MSVENQGSRTLRLELVGPAAADGRLRIGALVELVPRKRRGTIDEAGTITEMTLEDAEPSSGRSFWQLPTLDKLAEEQGIAPVDQIENPADGTWPEDESVEDFLAAIESRG